MLFKYLSLIYVASFAMSANSAEQANISPALNAGSLMQVFSGLAIVIFIIFMLSVVLKKLNMVPGSSNKLIKIVSGVSINNKDRILLVQVGDEQILVSACPGHISKLHKMKTPVEVDSDASIENSPSAKFSSLLNSVLSGKKESSNNVEQG